MGKRNRGNVLKLLLLVSCLLILSPLGVLASDDSVVRATSFSQFTDAVIDMINQNAPVVSSGTEMEEMFCNKRLIVKAKSDALDFRQYNPISVVQGSSTYILQFANCEDTKAAMEQLQRSGAVVYAEPDFNMKAEASGKETTKHYSWGVSVIGADKLAASLGSAKKQELRVAVIDSGVAAHPFLNERLMAGYDFVDNDEDPTDRNKHGTHVAGTVVDCTPGLNVKIMPVRVLDERGSGLSLTVALGVRYAVDHGASVINLSLSGRHSNFLDENISYAIGKGVTVVVAAGNEGEDTAYFCPAHISEAIVVGAVDSDFDVPSFSNRGDSLDVVAPGVDIKGPIPGNRFATLSGTSMAAPHVAAIAAMYKLQDPSRSPAQIEAKIKKNAKDLGKAGWDRVHGYGLVEAYRSGGSAKVTLNRSSLSLAVGGSAVLKATVTPESAAKKLTWKSSNKKIAAVKNGKVTAKSVGKATITVTAENGKKAACRVTVTKKGQKKDSSKVTLNKKKLSLPVGAKETLKATVSLKGAKKKLTWKSSNAKVATVKNGKVTAKKAGKATITVTAGNGKKATCSVTVTKKRGQNVQNAQTLVNYKDMLEKNKKYGYFSVCYINGDDIPDLMALTEKSSSNYVYYINGEKAADQTMSMMLAGESDLDELTYYYYPKRNLVMYRYKDAIPEVYCWEDYCTFASCDKNGYKHALMEVLTKSWEVSDDVAEYGYYCFSEPSVPEAQYDELLDKWVVGRDITKKEFNSILADLTGNVKRQEMKFIENTKANREKYLCR